MFRRRLVIQASFIYLCIASCTAWSEKKQGDDQKKHLTAAPVAVASEELPRFEEGYESKPKPRFATAGHPSGGDQYILEDDDGHVLGEDEGEFIDEEGHEEDYGQEQERGYQHDDKKVDDETQKDFKQTGAFQDFSKGGAVFDKHHKDHESENKANEDVNQHDAGEKFGSEALKEHKLGKHKEKSKGHKKYGFKNVYHKEEYGDHKTFHDEFLDNDHFHDYDDKHEHKQMQGGRFAKGYKKTGENKEHDVGDEKHAWGKAGHDGHAEGFYEKGGHLAGHHHGHKKQEGHYDANGSHAKKSAHKVRKGEVPVVSSVYHQGGDQPHYYSQVHHGGDDPVHLQSDAVIPDHHYESYHARHSGAQKDHDKPTKVYPHHHYGDYHARYSGAQKDHEKPTKVYPDHHYESYHARNSGAKNDKDKSTKVYTERGLRPAKVFQYHEQGTPVEARRLEVPVNERYSKKDIEKIHEPIKDNQPISEILPSHEAHKVHPYHYIHPENEQAFPNEERVNKYRQQHGISEPLKSIHHHKHLSSIQPSKLDLPVRHSFQDSIVNQQVPRSHHAEGNLHHHQPRDHGHHHFLIRPHSQQDSRDHQTEDQGISKPYPWWEASSSAKKHHQTRDFNQSPSYQHYGYAEVPEQTVPWRHREQLVNGEHEQAAASQQRSGYVRKPKKVEWKKVKSHHRHI